jgi:precorrin-6B methylase 2
MYFKLDLFIRKCDNVNFDENSNGEKRILEKLAFFNLNIIWDVGANIGDWSVAAKKQFPKAKITAFEIVPKSFDDLKINLEKLENMTLKYKVTCV